VAFGTFDGQAILASATSDRTVRLWDPHTGLPHGDPLHGHTGSVTGMAFGTLDGEAILASASDDGTVRLWDPATGARHGDPLPMLSPATAIAIHASTMAIATRDTLITLDLRATAPRAP
jgi:WD40 repeat protein